VHHYTTADEQLQAVFRAFPDLLFVLDHEGIILDYKGEEFAFSRVASGNILSRRIQDVMPAEIIGDWTNALEKVRESDSLVIFEYPFNSDHRQNWFEARLVPMPNGQIAAFVRDTTAHKQNELTIRRQLDRLAALRSIDLAITSSLDLNLTLSLLITQVMTQLDIDAASILLLDSNTQILRHAASHGFLTKNIQNAEMRMGEGYAGRAALTRQVMRVKNLPSRHTDILRSSFFAQEAFVDYYAVPLIAKGRVLGVLEIFNRTPIKAETNWVDFMNTLAGQAAIAIDNALLFNNYEQTNAALVLAYDATIEGWSRALELRDRETQGHTQRVAQMTVQVARRLGIDDEKQISQIRRGAILHDIGKMAIPDHILLKPGPLDAEEWEIMRRHPSIAVELLSPIPYLAPALEIPKSHHEKWDGTGYPDKLRGEYIPLSARLFAVVDVYDALTSDRPYRRAWSHEDALRYIHEESGKHFDPKAVEVFLKTMEDNLSHAFKIETAQISVRR